MRSLVLATMLGIVALSTSPALAEGPAKPAAAAAPSPRKAKAAKSAKPKKKKPVTKVAAAEPVTAPAPIASPAEPRAPAPAPVEKDHAPAATPEGPASAGTGVVLVLASGASYLGGGFGRGADVAAAFATLDLKVGAYVTPHLAIVGGVEIGRGVLFDGCAETCAGYHYQFPLVAEYAFRDRRRGAYLDGGFAILSTYGASASGETLEASVPLDLKLGAGYRIPLDRSKGMVAPSLVRSLDVRLGADFGSFKKIAYDSPALKADADIPDDRQALHYAIGLELGVAFAP